MFRGFVVDDSAAATATLVEALAELAGVTTIGTAASESDAIAWLANPANDWDIAIVDLQLGANGSGFRVLDSLINRQPHQRLVVWSASADTVARARCRILGCDRVFERATEVSGLLDYCMNESAARAMHTPANDRFPMTPRGILQPRTRFGMAPGLVAQAS